MIESVNNERVKMWSKLSDKKYQKEYGLFLVEGEHLVIEAQKAGLLKEVIALVGTPLYHDNTTYVSEPVMKKITTLSSIPKVIGVAYELKPREIRGNVLLLDGVQDPGNLGTIIRSAVAFDIDSILLTKGSVSIYNPKVVRATEGLMFHANIIENIDLEEMALTLKEEGYKIYTTKVDGGVSVKKVSFNEKSAIIIGSEGHGVSTDALEVADEYLYIDMSEKCESLNVGVATSIILYELSK